MASFLLPQADQIIFMAIQCSNRDKRLSRGSERLWQGFMDVNDVRLSPWTWSSMEVWPWWHLASPGVHLHATFWMCDWDSLAQIDGLLLNEQRQLQKKQVKWQIVLECYWHAASKDANDVNCFMPLKAFPKSYPSIGEEEGRRMLILMVMKNDDNRQTSKTHNT